MGNTNANITTGSTIGSTGFNANSQENLGGGGQFGGGSFGQKMNSEVVSDYASEAFIGGLPESVQSDETVKTANTVRESVDRKAAGSPSAASMASSQTPQQQQESTAQNVRANPSQAVSAPMSGGQYGYSDDGAPSASAAANQIENIAQGAPSAARPVAVAGASPVKEKADSQTEGTDQITRQIAPSQASEAAIEASKTPTDIIEEESKKPAYMGERHPGFVGKAKTFYKNIMAGKSTVSTGNNVNTKIITHPDISVGIREVSVGSDVLLDSIRQESVLLDRVNAYASKTNLKNYFKLDDFYGSDEQDSLSELIDVINRLEIPVVLSKSPISEQTSMQKRILRAHVGQGIALHPLAAKGYVADFDGDGATIHFNTELLGVALDAMECLYSIDGKTPLIDFEFMRLPEINVDSFTEILEARNIKNARKFAEAIKAKDAAMFADAALGISSYSRRAYAIDVVTRKASEIFMQGILEINDNSDYEIRQRIEKLNNLDLRPDEKYIASIVEKGSMPPNYQDFVTALARFNSDVEGKNPQFRVGADLGKIIKYDKNIFNGEEGLYDLYEQTCKAINATYMAGKAYLGDERKSLTEWKQNNVIRRAGFISDYITQEDKENPSFELWYEKFRAAYNEYTAMAEMAKHQFRMDMSAINIEVDKKSLPEIGRVNAGELANAVIEIYGDYSVGKMFGFKRTFSEKPKSKYKKAMLSKYENMSLRKFSQCNHCVTSKKPNEKHFVGKGITGSMQWENLFEDIADKRNGKASKYNENLNNNLKEQIKIFKKLNDMKTANKYEAKIERDALVKLLASCGPDIYAYFGMESTDSFLESEWGKLMSKATTADQLGGIRYAMVAEYRLDKVANLIRRQQESLTEIEKLDIQVQIECELQTLGSSSDAWSAIVHDICEGNELWIMLKANPREAIRNRVGMNAVSNTAPSDKNGNDIKTQWNNEIDLSFYPTAVDFLCDPMIGKDAKDAIISDMARMNERYANINGFETAYMLEADPSSTYAGSNTLGWSESSDDVLKESLDNMRKNIDNSYMAGKELTTDEVMTVLNYLKEPSNYIKIDDSIFADAVVAAMDKTYADTEKSKQQASVNALYSALSYQRNGGLYSDVYRGDNMVLGRLAWDQVSPIDLIRALSDPEFSIQVYDMNGNIAELSRESLCGGTTDEYVKIFLGEHPRMFAFMRGMMASVLEGSDGKITIAARMSVHETLSVAEDGSNAKDKALCILRDHPGWGAMCALFTPVHGNSSRSQRYSVRRTEQELLEALAYYRKIGEMPDFSKLRNVDLEEIAEIAGIEDIVRIDKVVENLFMKYSSEIDVSGINARKMNMRFDAESINMFFDVRQTLSGAKTSVSTGVEGAETMKTAASFPFFASLENIYASGESEDKVIYADEAKQSPSGVLKRIFANPFSKWFAVKRAKGGEEFNLKAKKSGDDGKDSITKSSKYPRSKSWEVVRNEVMDAYGQSRDIAAAEQKLGKILMDANHSIGYEDMDLADYSNIAHLLIKETDDGIIIRSMSQIAAAIRHRLPSYMDVSDFRNIPIEQIIEYSTEIADSCGTGKADILDIVYGMKLPSYARFNVATRQRSSSIERNAKLISELSERVRKAPASDNAGFFAPDERKAKHNSLKKMLDESDLEWADGEGGYGIMGVFDGKNDTWNAMPGAANVLVVKEDAGKESFDKAVGIAKKYGMTLVFPTEMANNVSPFIRKNMIPEPDGSMKYMMIPYFDIRLNGFGEARSGRIVFNEDNVIISVEDSLNEYGTGDASAVILQSMYDKVNIMKADEWTDDVTDMFADTMERYDGANFEFSVATKEEINNEIINWANPDIDIRVSKANRDYDKILNKISNQIDEFRYNWDSKNGVILKGRPDRIVGWAVASVKDSKGQEIHKAYAPIIPFTRYKENSKSVPGEFEINSPITFDKDKGNFVVPWTYKGKLDGQFLKMFEGLAAGNKMMAFGKPMQARQLKSGRDIDTMYAANTTSSRRLGWNARLQTMYSMMFQARMEPYGYNFAEGADSLPNDPELKAELLKGEIAFSRWFDMRDSGELDKKVWHKDARINAFVKNQIKMCLDRGIHPDDFLASRYTDDSGNVRSTHIYYEFDMLFKPSFSYQNNLMLFLNSLMPDLCPANLDDEGEGYLFKPCKEKGWSYGSMQQQVPRLDDDGNVKTWTWENVYTSFGFFSDDFSGFHSPGVDGADIMTQELAVAVQNGKVGNDGRLLGMFMDWAFSNAAPAPKPTSWRVEEMDFIKADGDFTWDPKDAVCFTGHRPNGLYGYNNDAAWRSLYARLYKAIEEQYNAGKRVFIHGGAQGVDMIAAIAVHKFRDSHPDVKSVMAIPFEGSQGFGADKLFGKQKYNELKDEADLATVLFEGKGSTKMYFDRNTWMLEHSSAVIAAYTGKTSGGTFDAIEKAKRMGLPVNNILDKKSFDDGTTLDSKNQKDNTNVESDKSQIDSFRGEYSFLSNMSPSTFIFDGTTYQNAEQAFQAAKLRALDNYTGNLIDAADVLRRYQNGEKISDTDVSVFKSELRQLPYKTIDWYRTMQDRYGIKYPSDLCEVVSTMSAKEAKKFGREIPLTEDILKEWNKEKRDVMFDIVEAKFQQNKDLAKKLKQTGDRKLIEGNSWGDKYWGVYNGEGENNLGKILEQIRDYI